ncbi:MAG: hypothetical protein ACRDY5_06140 [Acidimicrobiales bacterium]
MKTQQAAVALMAGGIAVALGVILLAADDGGGDGGDQAAVTTTTATGASSTTAASTATTAPGAPGAEALRLELRGLGPVRIGMTVAEASAALGRDLQALGLGDPDAGCELFAPAAGPDGVAFLVTGGTVARVDVIGGPVVTTDGLAIGQTEAEAQQRYGGRLAVTNHTYTPGGHYLTLVPADPADGAFRLVAETDGTTVTALRAGRLPEVEFPEGCS